MDGTKKKGKQKYIKTQVTEAYNIVDWKTVDMRYCLTSVYLLIAYGN